MGRVFFIAVSLLVVACAGCSFIGERRTYSDSNIRELEFVHHAVEQEIRQGRVDEERALELRALYDLVKEAYVTYAKSILMHFKFKSSAGAIKSVSQAALDVRITTAAYMEAVNKEGILKGGD